MSYDDGYNSIEGVRNGTRFSGPLGDVIHTGITNCNNCEIGWNSGYEMDNSPSDRDKNYSLYIEHIHISANNKIQRAYQTVGGVWVRGYQDGTWSSWTRL